MNIRKDRKGSSSGWHIAAIIFAIILAFSLATGGNSGTDDDGDDSPPIIIDEKLKITVKNKCSEEVRVTILLDGAYAGSIYLGTGYLDSSYTFNFDNKNNVKISTIWTYRYSSIYVPGYYGDGDWIYLEYHQDGGVTYALW